MNLRPLLVLPLAAVLIAQDDSTPVTFRTSVQEVNLDVIVRDSHGRQVKNLKSDEIEIYENGVKQDVKSFRFIPGKTVVSVERKLEKAPESAAPKLTAPVSPVPLPAVHYICIVFHNLDGSTMKYAMDAAQKFVNREMRPGTGVALFSLGTRLKALSRFSTDRDDISKLITSAFTGSMPNFLRASDAAFTATPYQATVTVSGTGEATMDLSGGEVNPEAILGADVGTSQSENIQRGLLADQSRAFGQIAGMQAWDQMNALINDIGPLPGRKTVLLLSGGLPVTGDPDLFQKQLDRANQGQITVYAVDVHGLTQNSSSLIGRAQTNYASGISRTQYKVSNDLAAAAAKSRQGDVIWNAVRTSDLQASLRALSEGTGGFLIANTEDLEAVFRKVEEDIDTHYEAVYSPSSSAYDGSYRRIEVKVNRKGVNVQSRVGYYALPALSNSRDLTVADVIGLAALNSKQRPHPFEYRTAVFDFPRAGCRNVLAIDVPASALTFAPLQKGFRVGASVLALVKDSSGQVVDKFSQDAQWDIPAEQADGTRKSVIPFHHEVDLAPGRYRVDTAILDRSAHRVSVATTEFENKPADGLGVSSVMLIKALQPVNGNANTSDPLEFPVSGGQIRRVVPNLEGNVSLQARPQAYFVIYPEKSVPEKPQIQADFLANGKVISSQHMTAPAPNAAGVIPLIIKAPAQPGKCELKITASQGSRSVTQTLTYEVAE